jgi:copper/silver efflux system protein
MVERIIEYSSRNRFIVFLLVTSLSAVGVWAMWQPCRIFPIPR